MSDWLHKLLGEALGAVSGVGFGAGPPVSNSGFRVSDYVSRGICVIRGSPENYQTNPSPGAPFKVSTSRFKVMRILRNEPILFLTPQSSLHRAWRGGGVQIGKLPNEANGPNVVKKRQPLATARCEEIPNEPTSRRAVQSFEFEFSEKLRNEANSQWQRRKGERGLGRKGEITKRTHASYESQISGSEISDCRQIGHDEPPLQFLPNEAIRVFAPFASCGKPNPGEANLRNEPIPSRVSIFIHLRARTSRSPCRYCQTNPCARRAGSIPGLRFKVRKNAKRSQLETPNPKLETTENTKRTHSPRLGLAAEGLTHRLTE